MTDDLSAGAQPVGAALARSLYERLAGAYDLRSRPRIVIGIGGESGSGKSVAATSLARALDAEGMRTCVIHADDYFHLPPLSNHERRVCDLRHVGPHEVNLTLIQEHIRDFHAARNNVVTPRVDYPANRFDTHRVDFGTFQAMVVEGTYVLPLEGLDVRIFFTATHQETLERRRRRNRDIDAPIINDILAIEHELIAPQSGLADILVDHDFVIRPRT
jgi:uridine kinase